MHSLIHKIHRLVYILSLIMLLGLPAYSFGTVNSFRLFQDYASIFSSKVDNHYEMILSRLYHEKNLMVITTIFPKNPWENMDFEINKYYNAIKGNRPGLSGYAVIVYSMKEKELKSQFSNTMLADLSRQNVQAWLQNAANLLAADKQYEMIDAMLDPIYQHYFGAPMPKPEKGFFGINQEQIKYLLYAIAIFFLFPLFGKLIPNQATSNRSTEAVQRRRR